MIGQLREQLVLPLVARDASHLLVDFNGLVRLFDLGEGVSEKSKSVQILGVRLEAYLQLCQRQKTGFPVALLKIESCRDPCILDVLPEVEDALDDAQGIVVALHLEQNLCRLPECPDGLVEPLQPGAGLGKPQVE